jgi:Arc/MetJ family transcription regulator
MKKRITTDIVIENLVAATCRDTTSSREKHMYREALRGLVRLAKSEHMLEMKANVDRLTGANAARAARRQAKAILLAQRLGATAEAGQKQLEFDQR